MTANMHLKLLKEYPARLSFGFARIVHNFTDKEKLRNFIGSKLLLQEELNGLL